MQYLSLSVFIATGGLLWLGSDQTAERAEVEIEIFGGEAEAAADVADRFLQPHERLSHVLRLLGCERAGVHAADRLPLHELPQELHEREHEARPRALHVLGIGVPARWRQIADTSFELGAQRLELAHVQRGLARAVPRLRRRHLSASRCVIPAPPGRRRTAA